VTKKKPKTAPEPAAADSGGASGSFAIVGIGASAGGLEAFEQFFRRVPAGCGLGFVLVPHLDPSHASILTDILQRCTAMPVVEASDQIRVEPEHVYVIAPNRDMAIFEGRLQLSIPEDRRGHRMPIDDFLRSLAQDRGQAAVGIILSGTGTDGTEGLRAIVQGGGVGLVQDPTMAKYAGMPRNAIDAGVATRVLAVEEMPAALLAGRHRAADEPASAGKAQLLPEGGVVRILMLLRSATGHDFSMYKKSTLRRRIERRMAQHELADIDAYGRYLKEHPAEAQILFKEMLIKVTAFFRDPEAFVALKRDVLPGLVDDKPDDYTLRVWVAGCSSGEEAYSICIVLREHLQESGRHLRIQLYATDLDEEAIGVARAGLYPASIAADVSADRLRRFFVKEDTAYRVKKEIRESVVFAVQNVIKDPPFTRMDLISCRNLLIYLEPQLQDRLLREFHYALKPGAVLMLSPSESTGDHAELFAALSRKWKLYRAVHRVAPIRTAAGPSLAWADNGAKAGREAVAHKPAPDIGELTRRALIEAYAPTSVVADLRGNIVYVHGDTGRYLRPAPGQPTLNVIDMAREGLQMDLREALLEAASRPGTAVERTAALGSQSGAPRVRISIRGLRDADAGQDLLVVSLRDIEAGASAKSARRPRAGASAQAQRAEELARELAYMRQNLQATIEEQQASNEELKSSNEELQSTNEELQSTNEELETSKEELQSLNEELVTVNAELQSKIEQLADVQSDMKNLLDNMNGGTIFLDRKLAIRRYTRDAARIYRLVATDVGRPLADIKCLALGDDPLIELAQRVLDTLVPGERELRTVGGASFLARMQPYRTLDNVIDGVVMTFTDISPRVAAETAMAAARSLAEGIVDTVREPLLVLDGGLAVVSASRSFYRKFKLEPAAVVGRRFYEIGDGQWQLPALRELLQTVLPRQQSFEGYTIEHEFADLGRRRLVLNARQLVEGASQTGMILLAMDDAGAV